MKKQLLKLFGVMLMGLMLPFTAFSTVTNPQVVKDLLNRIGGSGTSDRFVTIVDPTISTNGNETFTITSQNGKPCIKGSTTIAVTAGLNWYLNHYAYINLSWNQMTTDIAGAKLPLPEADETRECAGDCRYYMNYCTFSYSCTPWTWERWQKEIDWMALHGVNMPLVAVGMEAVWRNIMLGLGYTQDDVNNFVPGPSYQAWWLMGNLEGAGKPNPTWWYSREEDLAKKILARERELGMKPVLPGFAGLVPNIFRTKSTSTMTWSSDVKDGGSWGGFTSPAMTDPNTTNFAKMAKIFYDEQKKIMGTSKYYSMDLCHEGSGGTFLNNSSANKTAACQQTIAALDANIGDSTQWVIQHWGGNPFSEEKSAVAKKRAVILDLYADARHDWEGSFGGHDMVFCMLNNFGGKVGMHGRLIRTASEYFNARKAYGTTTLRGVGTTPEGIENNPMLFDALYELPWRTSFNATEWLRDYAKARYGTEDVDENLYPAWLKLGNSIFNYQDQSGLSSSPNQGPCETVFCARPDMTVGSASSWGFCTTKGWDTEQVRFAAKNMIDAYSTDLAKTANYQNDAVEVVRQSLSDYALPLLAQMNANSGNATKFKALNKNFLGLLLDMDSLLNAVPNCKVGKWTSQARAIADEPVAKAAGATETDKNWLEKNARTLISTWKEGNSSLHDYSNRLWGGMLKDYYYPRWQQFLAAKENGTTPTTGGNWYNFEYAWATSNAKRYPTDAVGDAVEISKALFQKYFCQFSVGGKLNSIFPIYVPESRTKAVAMYYNQAFTAQVTTPIAGNTAYLYVDYNKDGNFADNEKMTATGSSTTKTFSTTVPTSATIGTLNAKCIIYNGSDSIASLYFPVSMTADVPAPTELTIGNWIVPCTANGSELTLQTPTSGLGDMNIPETYTENGKTYKIVGIAAGALQNQTSLTNLSIPANVKKFDTATGATLSWNGDGTQKTVTLGTPLAAGSVWNLTGTFTTNDKNFNGWGSCLVASGTNPLADSYAKGFQLYLNSARLLKVKYSGGTTDFNLTGSSKFTVNIAYNGSNQMVITVTPDGKDATSQTVSATMGDITTLCYALPTGMNADAVTIINSSATEGSQLKGCTALKSIKVASGNTEYTTVDGVLYDAAKTTAMACPAKNIYRAVNIPTTATKIILGAFDGVSTVERIKSENATPAAAQSGAFKNCTALCNVSVDKADAYSTAWGLPIMLTVNNNATLSTAPSTAKVSVIELCADDNNTGSVTASVTPTNAWLTRTFGSKYAPIYLPKGATSIVTTGESGEKKAATINDLTIYKYRGTGFDKITDFTSLEPGGYLIAGTGSNKTFTFVTDGTADSPATTGIALLGNGTLKPINVNGNVYNYDAANDKFVLSAVKSISVNPFAAYMINFGTNPAGEIGGTSLGTGIIGITGVSQSAKYDLSGRRVNDSANGVIISKGKKVIK